MYISPGCVVPTLVQYTCWRGPLFAGSRFSSRNVSSGCAMGSVPPFALNPALGLVVEEDLLGNDTLFFNAGRLDRSMELDTKDWLAVAKPRVARIAT